jgi:NADH-quinone oxidoreductase subunit D
VLTGAYTGFLYVFQFREKVYEIYEEICGACLTTNMGRIGGLKETGLKKHLNYLIPSCVEFPVAWKEFENLFERNRIFIDRTVNVGAITAEKLWPMVYRT